MYQGRLLIGLFLLPSRAVLKSSKILGYVAAAVFCWERKGNLNGPQPHSSPAQPSGLPTMGSFNIFAAHDIRDWGPAVGMKHPDLQALEIIIQAFDGKVSHREHNEHVGP